jgi:hypothetical protein
MKGGDEKESNSSLTRSPERRDPSSMVVSDDLHRPSDLSGGSGERLAPSVGNLRGKKRGMKAHLSQDLLVRKGGHVRMRPGMDRKMLFGYLRRLEKYLPVVEDV